MPDAQHPADRTPAQRAADHASLARLSETLVPALVAKLTGTGLGEVEVREGDWRIRVRRPLTGGAAIPARRADRPRLGTSGSHTPAPRPAAPVPAADPTRAIALSPAVGIYKGGVAIGTRVHAGDRIATVDLLGIPQEVPAPIDGTVVELFVAVGEAVEYGEEIGAVEAAPDPEQAPGGGSDPASASGEG